MSGPYAAGLGVKRRKASTPTPQDSQEEDFFSLDEEPTPKRRRITHADAEVIPKFEPEDNTNNVATWLHKIDQLGDVYGWNTTDRQFIMQLRLRGSARRWYDDLDDYNLSWAEWKKALETAFPRSVDYVDRLETMLARNKSDTETMTKYFHDKLSLLKKCGIHRGDAISCIIRGLPIELQANAKAYQCEDPEQLYYGYLSSLENYKKVEATMASRKSTWRRGDGKSPATTPSMGVKRCYACRRIGHEARDCRSQQQCSTCQRMGHTTATCWFAATPGSLQQGHQTRQVSNILYTIKNNELSIYKRPVHIKNLELIAYIDTGSKTNILTRDKAKLLNLKIFPSGIVMKGFGGAQTQSLGRVNISVFIDNVCLRGYVEITERIIPGIDLIIGQPMINQPGISLVTTECSASFIKTQDSENSNDILTYIKDFTEKQKFSICLKCDTTLPKQSCCLVDVFVDIESKGDDLVFLTNSVYFQLGNMCYAIPGGIVSVEGCLKVINMSDCDIFWPAHKLIARAELVDIYTPKAATEVLTIGLSSDGIVTNGHDLEGIGKVDIGELNNDETDKLLTLLGNFRHLFAKDTNDLGCTDLIEMKIKTNTDKPVYCKPYRMSHKEQEIVDDKIRELLAAGIIRESMSEYCSPIILVKKKGGDYRMCIDYRALNSQTVKDRYPLPHIEDQVSKLSGKAYFTTLDLAQGYHQVKLSEDSIPKTAFVTHSGQYEFLKMPFGLANAPAVFSRLIRIALNDVASEIACYLDDVMLPTVTVEAGLQLLEQVLVLLQKANLKLNVKKCAFLKTSVNYLGHEITAGSVRPGLAKINCVSEYKRPRNVHEVRQFIGLTSYFRKFIRGFAEIALPLTKLTKKDVSWLWGIEQENAFQTLKNKLVERPVLGIYDSKAATELHTDASKLGLGGILMQRQSDNSLKPIAYFSRTTSKEEQNYHSYELETLAVVESLKRFRIYLVGIPVKIVTDCAALRTTLSKKDLVPRIARWWLSIQDFDLNIEYRPGDRMKHVDALSRNPVNSNVCMIEETDWLITLQMQDENIQNIIRQLQNHTNNPDIVNNYVFKDEKLYRKTFHGERFVIPKLAKYGLMQKYHDQIGHPGFSRCEALIKEQFWFPKMTRFIRKYLNSCIHCAYGKGNYGKTQGELHPIEKIPIPMHTLHVDHLGPFVKTRRGNAYVLVVIDAFTKFVFARPVKNCGSVETIKHLKEIISQFGNPVRVITDRGKAFTSRYFKQFADENHFKHVLNAIASPRSNGQVERVNRTIIDGLNTMSESENVWDDKLIDVVWGINNTPNSTTTFPPFKLMFSHENSRLHINPTGEVQDPAAQQQALTSRREIAKLRIDRNMTLMKTRYDQSHKKCIKYSLGDLVLWKGGATKDPRSKVNQKLASPYTGPYKICKIEPDIDRYTICTVKGMKGYKKFSAVVRGDVLRPYKSMTSNTDSSSSDGEVDRDDLIDLLES